MADHEVLVRAMKAVRDAAAGIVPVAGEVSKLELERIATAIEALAEVREAGLASLDDDDRGQAEAVLASLYGRCAAIAIAGGDGAAGHRWIVEAQQFAHDRETQDELISGVRNPDNLRALWHGRVLFELGKERRAVRLWRALAKTGDGLAAAARAELKAPRPLNGASPSLWTYNGCGLRFVGRRDYIDSTYVTTHCVTLVYVPLFPLGAYRVSDAGEGYYILLREPLSAFARVMRYVIVGAIVATIALIALNSYLGDPDRLMRKRFDAVLTEAPSAPPEQALRELDALLAEPDMYRAGRDRVERIGAEIIRITAAMAPKPFTAAHVDQAARLVQRYQGLPPEARGAPARDVVTDALERWIEQVAPPDAKLALLRLAIEVADGPRASKLMTQRSAARLAVADARAAERPLDALAVLAEEASTDTMARAAKIVARLVEAPSMLAEAGADLDRWIDATPPGDPLRAKVIERREAARAGRAEAEAEAVTPAQLAAMAKARPWDQHVQIRLAQLEIEAGKLDLAAARIGKLGEPGMIVRPARLLLGQLASALGNLEQADALLTGLLAGRIERFTAASAALDGASKAAWQRVERALKTGDLPPAVIARYEAATGDDAKQQVVQAWAGETVEQDPAVARAKEAYLALADIVPVSIAAGTVKLRRAQALAGAAREAMLLEAERTFLAIRSAAEGQPEFRLGLGEIYARLGKSAESDVEFAAVLEKRDPDLTLRVVSTYRSIGRVERAREIATELYNGKADVAFKQRAALLLGLLESGVDDTAAEAWYRKANQSDRHVRSSLLSFEAQRLLREGKLGECAARYTAVARMLLEGPQPNYNNAALAHLGRYNCTGDLAALTDSEAALEKAYRETPENPIIVGNVAAQLISNSRLRVLGKRVDLRMVQLESSNVEAILRALAGPERAAMVADLAADRAAQRSVEMLAQFEVLAPSNTAAYRLAFHEARLRDNLAAGAAVVERARRAKLDTSEAVAARAKKASTGEPDPEQVAYYRVWIARSDAAIARGVTGKTRAAALMLGAIARSQLGLETRDRALLARARDAAIEAQRAWPALDLSGIVNTTRLDEAGLAADADAWAKLRIDRTAVAAITKLVADRAPLAETIRGGKPWSAHGLVPSAAAAVPGIDDLRVARLVGDAAAEARARAVLDDKLVRLSSELDAVLDPGDPSTPEDLAYLDKR